MTVIKLQWSTYNDEVQYNNTASYANTLRKKTMNLYCGIIDMILKKRTGIRQAFTFIIFTYIHNFVFIFYTFLILFLKKSHFTD